MKPANDDKPNNPLEAARQARPKPRRFYETVSVAEENGAFAVLLDGRPMRTPMRNALALPSRAMAEAVAREWRDQGAEIDVSVMEATRLANTALDRVAGREFEIRAEMVSFGASDLLCYRAEEPEELVERQRAAWDPVLGWLLERFGARLVTTGGVAHVEQETNALDALASALAAEDAYVLTALHNMTTLTGSVGLALAVRHGFLTASAAWEVAHVDERWQRERWGKVDLAVQRHAFRTAEFEAAVRFLELLDRPTRIDGAGQTKAPER